MFNVNYSVSSSKLFSTYCVLSANEMLVTSIDFAFKDITL